MLECFFMSCSSVLTIWRPLKRFSSSFIHEVSLKSHPDSIRVVLASYSEDVKVSVVSKFIKFTTTLAGKKCKSYGNPLADVQSKQWKSHKQNNEARKQTETMAQRLLLHICLKLQLLTASIHKRYQSYSFSSLCPI